MTIRTTPRTRVATTIFKRAIAGASLAVILASGAAQAMPAAYCDAYTREAIREYHHALSSRACRGPLAELPIRWHDNYDIHFRWCLDSSYEATIGERNARLEVLHACY